MSDPRDALFTTPEMTAIFSAESHIQHMLTFEAALARAEARAGIIPQEAAAAIAAGCRVELYDLAEIYHEALAAGTLAIPLVRMLTAQIGPEPGRFVHWGATSQDAIDTALVLQMREGLDLLVPRLLVICATCAAMTVHHRHTLMAGRTLLQQALPITFGLKAARWLALATRQVQALRQCRHQSLVLQFGGAAGTLAALGSAGLRVAELLGEELGLALPDLPWHAERDRIATVAAALGITAGAMAKIAGDISLLSQTEISEIAEAGAPGKGGSSAMPHKRNPVHTVAASAAARLAIGVVPVILSAMTNEHERAVGGWQTEWAAIPDLFRYTAGAVDRVHRAVAGMRVDAGRMLANLESSGGLLLSESLAMALAPALGRHEAQIVVKKACDQVLRLNLTLRDVALGTAQIRSVLSPEQIEQALNPANYLGGTNDLIDRALQIYREVQSQ